VRKCLLLEAQILICGKQDQLEADFKDQDSVCQQHWNLLPHLSFNLLDKVLVHP